MPPNTNQNTIGIDIIANDKTSNVLQGITKQIRDVTKEFTALGRQVQDMAFTFLKIGGAIETALIGAATKFSEIDRALRSTQVITKATAEEYDKFLSTLTDSIDKTAYGFKDMSKALYELAAIGYSAEDSIKAFDSVLKLAVATGGDLSYISRNVATVFHEFGISAEQSSQAVAALYEATSGSLTALSRLFDIFQFIAPQVQNTNVAFNEVVAVLSALYEAGYRSSRAGWALRTLFQNLIDPSKEFQEILDNFGISVTAINPQVVGLYNALRNLKAGIGDSTIAFKAFNAVAGAPAVVLLQNLDSVEKFLNKLNELQGSIETAYKEQIKSLWAELGRLKAAFDELVASISPSLTGALQVFIELLRSISSLAKSVSPELKSFAGTFLSVIGTFALITGGISLAISLFIKLAGTIGLIAVAVKSIGALFGQLGAVLLGLKATLITVTPLVAALGAAIAALLTASIIDNAWKLANALSELKKIKAEGIVQVGDIVKDFEGWRESLIKMGYDSSKASALAGAAVKAIRDAMQENSEVASNFALQFKIGMEAVEKLFAEMEKGEALQKLSKQIAETYGTMAKYVTINKDTLKVVVNTKGAFDELRSSAVYLFESINDGKQLIDKFGASELEVISNTKSMYDAISGLNWEDIIPKSEWDEFTKKYADFFKNLGLANINAENIFAGIKIKDLFGVEEFEKAMAQVAYKQLVLADEIKNKFKVWQIDLVLNDKEISSKLSAYQRQKLLDLRMQLVEPKSIDISNILKKYKEELAPYLDTKLNIRISAEGYAIVEDIQNVITKLTEASKEAGFEIPSDTMKLIEDLAKAYEKVTDEAITAKENMDFASYLNLSYAATQKFTDEFNRTNKEAQSLSEILMKIFASIAKQAGIKINFEQVKEQLDAILNRKAKIEIVPTVGDVKSILEYKNYIQSMTKDATLFNKYNKQLDISQYSELVKTYEDLQNRLNYLQAAYERYKDRLPVEEQEKIVTQLAQLELEYDRVKGKLDEVTQEYEKQSKYLSELRSDFSAELSRIGYSIVDILGGASDVLNEITKNNKIKILFDISGYSELLDLINSIQNIKLATVSSEFSSMRDRILELANSYLKSKIELEALTKEYNEFKEGLKPEEMESASGVLAQYITRISELKLKSDSTKKELDQLIARFKEITEIDAFSNLSIDAWRFINALEKANVSLKAVGNTLASLSKYNVSFMIPDSALRSAAEYRVTIEDLVEKLAAIGKTPQVDLAGLVDSYEKALINLEKLKSTYDLIKSSQQLTELQQRKYVEEIIRSEVEVNKLKEHIDETIKKLQEQAEINLSENAQAFLRVIRAANIDLDTTNKTLKELSKYNISFQISEDAIRGFSELKNEIINSAKVFTEAGYGDLVTITESLFDQYTSIQTQLEKVKSTYELIKESTNLTREEQEKYLAEIVSLTAQSEEVKQNLTDILKLSQTLSDTELELDLFVDVTDIKNEFETIYSVAHGSIGSLGKDFRSVFYSMLANYEQTKRKINELNTELEVGRISGKLSLDDQKKLLDEISKQKLEANRLGDELKDNLTTLQQISSAAETVSDRLNILSTLYKINDLLNNIYANMEIDSKAASNIKSISYATLMTEMQLVSVMQRRSAEAKKIETILQTIGDTLPSDVFNKLAYDLYKINSETASVTNELNNILSILERLKKLRTTDQSQNLEKIISSLEDVSNILNSLKDVPNEYNKSLLNIQTSFQKLTDLLITYSELQLTILANQAKINELTSILAKLDPNSGEYARLSSELNNIVQRHEEVVRSSGLIKQNINQVTSDLDRQAALLQKLQEGYRKYTTGLDIEQYKKMYTDVYDISYALGKSLTKTVAYLYDSGIDIKTAIADLDVSQLESLETALRKYGISLSDVFSDYITAVRTYTEDAINQLISGAQNLLRTYSKLERVKSYYTYIEDQVKALEDYGRSADEFKKVLGYLGTQLDHVSELVDRSVQKLVNSWAVGMNKFASEVYEAIVRINDYTFMMSYANDLIKSRIDYEMELYKSELDLRLAATGAAAEVSVYSSAIVTFIKKLKKAYKLSDLSKIDIESFITEFVKQNNLALLEEKALAAERNNNTVMASKYRSEIAKIKEVFQNSLDTLLEFRINLAISSATVRAYNNALLSNSKPLQTLSQYLSEIDTSKFESGLADIQSVLMKLVDAGKVDYLAQKYNELNSRYVDSSVTLEQYKAALAAINKTITYIESNAKLFAKAGYDVDSILTNLYSMAQQYEKQIASVRASTNAMAVQMSQVKYEWSKAINELESKSLDYVRLAEQFNIPLLDFVKIVSQLKETGFPVENTELFIQALERISKQMDETESAYKTLEDVQSQLVNVANELGSMIDEIATSTTQVSSNVSTELTKISESSENVSISLKKLYDRMTESASSVSNMTQEIQKTGILAREVTQNLDGFASALYKLGIPLGSLQELGGIPEQIMPEQISTIGLPIPSELGVILPALVQNFTQLNEILLAINAVMSTLLPASLSGLQQISQLLEVIATVLLIKLIESLSTVSKILSVVVEIIPTLNESLVSAQQNFSSLSQSITLNLETIANSATNFGVACQRAASVVVAAINAILAAAARVASASRAAGEETGSTTTVVNNYYISSTTLSDVTSNTFKREVLSP
jgi:TP901 family phage tail tape measure protein